MVRGGHRAAKRRRGAGRAGRGWRLARASNVPAVPVHGQRWSFIHEPQPAAVIDDGVDVGGKARRVALGRRSPRIGSPVCGGQRAAAALVRRNDDFDPIARPARAWSRVIAGPAAAARSRSSAPRARGAGRRRYCATELTAAGTWPAAGRASCAARRQQPGDVAAPAAQPQRAPEPRAAIPSRRAGARAARASGAGPRPGARATATMRSR